MNYSQAARCGALYINTFALTYEWKLVYYEDAHICRIYAVYYTQAVISAQ